MGSGLTENVSLSGVRIEHASRSIPIQTEIRLRFPFFIGSFDTVFHGTVIRHTGGGFAVQFGDMDEAQLVVLRRLRNPMGEPRTIAGCLVLKEAPARELLRYKVVICQLPDVKEGEQPRTRSATTGVPRYVVWYIDDKGNPTDGRYYKEHEDAHAEFDRRTQSIPL